MVIHASLCCNTQHHNIGILIVGIHESTASTNIPSEVLNSIDIEMQLIESRQAQSSYITSSGITKVHFQTMRVTETPLVRDLSSETLTTANADTDSVALSTSSKGKTHDCE